MLLKDMIDNSKNPGKDLRKNQFLACFFGVKVQDIGQVWKWLKPDAACIEVCYVNQDQQVPGKPGKLSELYCFKAETFGESYPKTNRCTFFNLFA